jgi:hypothetical protein
MLPLFYHNVTKETFVLHYATAADRRRAKRSERGVRRNRVPVRFAPIRPKPRELAWAAHKRDGTRYR